jgi:hypothetical protein
MTKRLKDLESACKAYEEDLVLHYYGDNNDADRDRITRHLSSCSRCRVFIDDLRRLLPQMAQTEEMPQSFWDGYYRETVAKLVEHEQRKYRWRSFFAPLHTWMVPAFGTVAVVVMVVSLLFGKGNLGFFMEQSSAKIPQEILVDSNQLEFFKSMDMLESLDNLEEQNGKPSELHNTQSSRVGPYQGIA